jgi:L,D-transpeptidase ErfK/SrfK
LRILCSLFAVYLFAVSTVFANPELHINIPEYALRLVENSQVIKVYNIAVGTPYEQTPIGNFQIFAKQEYPTWYPGANFNDRTPVPPGPDNPLGTRWMEFTPHYGIHGTNKGWDINYPVSGGCIRMQDADARELYDKVPLGTPVYIKYQTMYLIEKADGLYVTILPDVYHYQTNTPENLQQLFAAYADKYIIVKDITSIYKLDIDTVFEAKIAERKTASVNPIPPIKPTTPSNSTVKGIEKPINKTKQ